MAAAILSPLIRALNRRVAAKVARVHVAAYKDDSKDAEGGTDGPSFVQQHLAVIFDEIAKNQLAKLPPEYACMVAFLSRSGACTHRFPQNQFGKVVRKKEEEEL